QPYGRRVPRAGSRVVEAHLRREALSLEDATRIVAAGRRDRLCGGHRRHQREKDGRQRCTANPTRRRQQLALARPLAQRPPPTSNRPRCLRSDTVSFAQYPLTRNRPIDRATARACHSAAHGYAAAKTSVIDVQRGVVIAPSAADVTSAAYF